MKNIKKIIALVLAIISIMAIAIPAFAERTYTSYPTSGSRYITAVTGKYVNVRKGPGKDFDLAPIKQFRIGTWVTLSAYSYDLNNEKWYNVSNGKNSGWVKEEFLADYSDGNGDAQFTAWEERYGITTWSRSYASKKYHFVMNLQTDLQSLGFYLGPKGPDGYYGDYTAMAVESFQRRNGLTVDGVAGPKTKAALYKAVYGQD